MILQPTFAITGQTAPQTAPLPALKVGTPDRHAGGAKGPFAGAPGWLNSLVVPCELTPASQPAVNFALALAGAPIAGVRSCMPEPVCKGVEAP